MIPNFILYLGIIILMFLVGSQIKITRRLFQGLTSFFSLPFGTKSRFFYTIFRPYRPDFLSFQSNEEFVNKFPNYTINSLEVLEDQIQTGDLIFFVSPISIGLGNSCKWANMTPFNHMGIIIRDGDEISVLEASGATKSVRVVPLDSKLDKSVYCVVAYRRLVYDRDEQFYQIVDTFKEQNVGKVHDGFTPKGSIEMIKSALDINIPIIHKELFVNHRSSEGYFCSELAADLYMRLGIIPDDIGDIYPDSNEYTPGDFSTIYDKVTLNREKEIIYTSLNKATLEQEIFIEF